MSVCFSLSFSFSCVCGGGGLVALQCLWGPGDYEKEMEEMRAEQKAIGGEGSKSLLELFRDKNVRWQLITMLVVNGSIQFCGISAVRFMWHLSQFLPFNPKSMQWCFLKHIRGYHDKLYVIIFK